MDPEKRKKIEAVAERMKTPESKARRIESARQSRERVRKILEGAIITEEFLRRRVTI